MEAVDQLIDNGLHEQRVYPVALVTVLWGLAAAVVVAWFHGEKGRQRVGGVELALLAGVVLGWVVTVLAVGG
jgi:hypothetical protein